MPYLTIDEIAGHSERGYPQNVRKAVLNRLVKRGVLKGKEVDGKPAVEDGPALQRILGFGIEDFVYNTQGWTFMAVHAPLQRVAELLKARKDVTLCYDASAKVLPLHKNSDLTIQPSPSHRDVFLMKTHGSDWTVLVQTVHWIQGSDPLLALFLTAELSDCLQTQTLAMWDDDFSGQHLVACENGNRTRYLCSEADDWEELQTFIYECGIHVPKCFIASSGNSASLHVAEPAVIEQADAARLAIPKQSEVTVPHALEKLEMMAEAMEEEIEDGADFCNHMVDGLWKQVTALRSASR